MSKYDVKVNISTSILVCFKKKYYLCCLKSFGKIRRMAKSHLEKYILWPKSRLQKYIKHAKKKDLQRIS